MTSVLINNFPSKFAILNNYDESKREWSNTPSNLQVGYEMYNNVHAAKLNALKKFFLSLLLYDVVYLKYSDYRTIIDTIGFSDTITLLKSGAIKVIFDCHDFSFITNNTSYSISYCVQIAPLRDLYEGFSTFKHNKKALQSQLRYLTDKNKILLPTLSNEIEIDSSYAEQTIEEVNRDLESKTLCSTMGYTQNNASQLKLSDHLHSMRLCNLVSGFAIQSRLKIDSIVQDAISEKYIKNKLLLSGVITDPTRCFEWLLDKKGIPDLYDLYKKKVFTISDIMRVRDKAHSIAFRQWVYSHDYNEDEVIRALLSNKTSSSISKLARFIYPNVLGLISPIAGLAASGFDSFLLDKIVKSWEPNLFLDNTLSAEIDNKLKRYKKSEEKQVLMEKYGDIGRNEVCFCGSGKKFKRCHGNM